MLVLGRDIVYDHSTAYAHDVCCECFSKRLRNNLARRAEVTVCTEIKKSQIISSVVQYQSSLETVGKLVKPVLDRCLKI